MRRRLEELVSDIGRPYPHGQLAPSDERKQSTRLLKLTCPECGYVIRTTRKWLETGLPTCCCGELFVADE